MRAPLLHTDDHGLFCAAGGFYIDPWRPVERAVISHAHGDHARWGSQAYLGAEASVPVLRRRLGEAAIEGVPWGEKVRMGEVTVSFHPAGHILGSAQVRVEREGEVWVFSGDYKRAADPTCEPFEPVACHTFITEATFALPIYRWDPTAETAREVFDWWEGNREAGRASVLFCYALGKAQRILAELARFTDRTVFVHGSVEPLNECYRDAGVALLPTRPVSETAKGQSFAGELILAPPSAGGSTWMRRFGQAGTAFASGWMRVRGTRRRRGFDRGFVVSDHADWPDLLRTIRDTGAERVLTTHGYADSFARYLREQGIAAGTLSTPFQGETED
ncbi:MAG: ligase-associated DNA damage response exonuclease [Thermoanaerobaculia bacterium]